MSPITGENNKSHQGGISSEVQAAWSTRRSWHGEEVKMSIRTKLVKDDAKAELKVMTGDGKTEIDKVDGKKITDSKLDHTYKINWKGKDFAGQNKFVLQVKIDEKLEAEPVPVLVDVEPPIFSA